MPLRDHFRPPLDNETPWEGFHGGWPMMIVAHLTSNLPRYYMAAPRVHSGAVVATCSPVLDEYEVRVYDSKRGRRLVATVEIVSPANKDRPEHRRAFVAKCIALLQNRVCVAIVGDFLRPQPLVRTVVDGVAPAASAATPTNPSSATAHPTDPTASAGDDAPG